MSIAMETRARVIFRGALAVHYVDGISVGHHVDSWLKTHGGWFPDPKEPYCDGTPLTQPMDDGEFVMSIYPMRAISDAKAIMPRLYAALDIEHERELKKSAEAWMTDVNINEPASLPRDRSRSPLRIQALSESARAALDVVCKRDEPERVAEQRTTIAKQAMEIENLKKENAQLRTTFLRGHGIHMPEVWRAYRNMHPERSLEYISLDKKQTLHQFLHETATKLIALQKLQESVSNALQGVALDFPVEVVESDSEASD